jgi:uncharacterized protein YdeI (YjbR/CyaY-like superfamily)
MTGELMDPRVDAYIERAAPFAQPILEHLRELMHQACPHATETMKWGMPFFVKQGVILAHLAAFKHHCAFGFWGPQMKKILAADGWKASNSMGAFGRLTRLEDLPSGRAMPRYMAQAAELVESGEGTQSIQRPKKAKKKKPVAVPPELAAALKKNKIAAKAFADISPSRKREYCLWIAAAKRPETISKRVRKAVTVMLQGNTLLEGRQRGTRYCGIGSRPTPRGQVERLREWGQRVRRSS